MVSITEGPWVVGDDSTYGVYVVRECEPADVIANVLPFDEATDFEANARAIALVPELVAALRWIVGWRDQDERVIDELADVPAIHERQFDEDLDVYDRARAVLAKLDT